MNRPTDLPVSTDFGIYLHDRPEQDIFTIDRRIFTDPDLFELEMKYIWEGTWLYLAHESQLPNPNDFFTTFMGRHPVVLIRGEDGVIRGFINACAHRGATLCRTARGNKKFLVCPYHGWTYDTTGKNVDIKDLDSGGYPDNFARQSHDLIEIARLKSYRGFLFGSLNADVPELETHLAGAKRLIDLLSDQSPDGLEVLPGISHYTYNANWKMQAENGVDGYHATTLHAVYFNVAKRRGQRAAAGGGVDKVKPIDAGQLGKMPGGAYDLGNGHSLMWAEMPNPQDRPLNVARDALESRFGEKQARWMINRMRNMLFYPNVFFMDQTSSQIRVFRPLAVDKTLVTIYGFAPKGENAQARERRVRQYEDFFNASGMATPDDLEEFERCQVGFGARIAPTSYGYDRGMARMKPGPDQYAAEIDMQPAVSSTDPQDETCLFQGQYRTWLRLMTEGAARDR